MKIDHELLEEFERMLDTRQPEDGPVPIRVLGFGEISLVFEILTEKNEGLAFKRLPIFNTEEQVTRHVNAYNEYNRLLKEEVGINVPPYGTDWVFSGKKKKKITLFCVQEKLNPASIGNQVIHHVSDEEIKILVGLILKELTKVWDFNQKKVPNLEIGFDGQISNWAVVDYDENDPLVTEQARLSYVDTSTPLFRIDGEEAMEPVLFLKSAPSGLRWLLKLLFLQEVVDRYYDFRSVVTDLLANFYKEQLPEIVPSLIDLVNEFFTNEGKQFEMEPFTLEEIESYYKGDKRIWVIFQGFRRMDRFIKTKILRKKYDFYLPDKIKR
ncbi:MAG: DUF6206 family protein [Candidatus Helarchaeota archaeon]